MYEISCSKKVAADFLAPHILISPILEKTKSTGNWFVCRVLCKQTETPTNDQKTDGTDSSSDTDRCNFFSKLLHRYILTILFSFFCLLMDLDEFRM